MTYPNHKHIVIAHSHGGNVVLHALKDDELSSRIAGIITVGTPFLIAQEVSAGAEIMHGLIAGCFRNPVRSLTLIMVLLAAIVSILLDQLSSYSSVAGALHSRFTFSFCLFGMILICPLLFVFKRQFEASVRWFEELQTPHPRCKWLCLFAKYDVPGALLGTLSTLRTALGIGEFLLVAALLLVAILCGVILLPYVVVFGLLGYLSYFHILRSTMEAQQARLLDHDQPFSFAAAALGAALIALVLIPVLSTILDMLAFGTFGFGLAEWRHGWFFKQTSSMRPPSAVSAQVEHFELADLAKEFGWFDTVIGLRHSVLFKSRVGLESIQKFVASLE